MYCGMMVTIKLISFYLLNGFAVISIGWSLSAVSDWLADGKNNTLARQCGDRERGD